MDRDSFRRIAAATSVERNVIALYATPVSRLQSTRARPELQRNTRLRTREGRTPREAASICLDGLDVVVTTLGGRDIPPTRSRALLARCRSHAATLITTDGRMPGNDLVVASRIVGFHGVGQGRGRLRSITIDTTVHGRATQPRTGRYTLTAPTYGDRTGMQWMPADAGAAGSRRDGRRFLAAAQ